MEDDKRSETGRQSTASILFPWRKVKGLNPRRLFQSRISGQRDIGSSFSFALSALKKRPSSVCPSCHAPSSVKLIEAITNDSGDTTYILGCDHCDYIENLEMKIEAVTKTIDDLRTGERRFLIAAVCAVGFGFAYYFFTGYILTLVGSVFIAAILLINAMTFRYRVWQLVHKRLYQNKAPMREWLKQEFS